MTRAAWSITAVALGLLVAGHADNVVNGGFFYDDWDHLAARRLEPTVGAAWASVNEGVGGNRPVLAAVLLAPFYLFGASEPLHLAYLLVTAVAAAGLFLLLLRRTGVPPVDAAVIAGFALLFPWSSSTRLWATMAANNIAVVLALGALLLICRPRWPQQLAGAILQVAAVLVYDAVVLLPLLALALREGKWRDRLRPVDVALVAVGFIFALTNRGDPVSVRTVLRTIFIQGLETGKLAGRAIVPFAPPVGGVLLLALAAAVLWSLRRGVDRWARLALFGATVTALGYLPFAARGLTPLSAGIGDRVNLIAAFGIVTTIYACVRSVLERAPRPATTAAVLYGVALIVVFTVLDQRRAAEYVQAEERRQDVLEAIDVSPAPGQVLLVTGPPAEISDGIPVFAEAFDLQPALRLDLGAPALTVFPVFEGADLSCTSTGVVLDELPGPWGDLLVDGPATYSFESLLFVDAGSGRLDTLTPASCATTVRGIEMAAMTSPAEAL